MNSKKISQNGSAILYLIILIPFLITIAANFMRLATNSFNIARKDQFATYSQLAADAGVDAALEQINIDPDWMGSLTVVGFHNSNGVRTSYQTFVATSGPSSKILISIGYAYAPAQSTTPKSVTTLNVNLRSVTSGDFSIVAGVGGLELENHAKVLGGDVHVNGRVNMKNHAQIGLLLAPANLTVANQSCPQPVDSNYPRLCNIDENDDPISIINDAHVYGDVRANHQFTQDFDDDGSNEMTDPGLTSSSGVAVQPLPAHDRAAQIAAVSTTRTGADASCTTNGGIKTWTANTKIVGDVTISGTSNSCVVTILGDVWITGKLVVENRGKIVVSELALNNRPDVMIDNKLTEFKNTASIEANSLGTGVQFISYWSANSCTYDPVSPCANISGQDLYDSQGVATIKLDNSAAGLKTIFYAKFSKLLIANSGDIGALVGQTVHLQNSGTVTFGSSVTGGLTFWVIDGYRRVY